MKWICLGKVYVEYSLPGGYHHDYFEMDNGNLLIASDDFDNDSGTVEDYVVELDRDTGNIVKEFDLKKNFKYEDGKSENWIEYDWFHNKFGFGMIKKLIQLLCLEDIRML